MSVTLTCRFDEYVLRETYRKASWSEIEIVRKSAGAKPRFCGLCYNLGE